ncbi:hypothetical protein KIW84_UN0709 [Lathyrus oleraceus]|nr:hypothetical protein KIW84_UN0709 [Pisum sativum]
MAQRQQRAAPFVFTPQLELDLKRGVYRHNSHSKKWTRTIADEDFRFPPDTKIEVLRQKWRRMRKDDPKLSILLNGPSRLEDEMLGLGGTPGGVPLAALEGVSLVAPDGVPLTALEGVSLVAPDGVPLAAPVSVSLAAPDGITPPPNGFPLVAPVGVPPPPDDIRPPPPDGSPLTTPDGVPPPPPSNDLPLVASDDLYLRTLMAQRQQRTAPFVFTPQLELVLKRGVYRHNSHSKKWTRIIADEDFRFPPDTKTEVQRQKWRRMRKDDPKLFILLSGPSLLVYEMLGLGGTPGDVPLADLEGVTLVAPDGVPLAAVEGVSLVAPDDVPLAALVRVSLAAPDGVTPPLNGFPLVAPIGVPPPPDDIRPPPPDGSPLTAPDGVPPPPPPNDLPLVASDDLHLRTLMAQRQQRAAPFLFTPQLELDLKRGVYRHNSHSKKWTRIIADEDFRFPPDTKTEQKWRRMRKDDPKLSILLSGPSSLEDEMLGLGGTPGGVPLAPLEGVSLVAPDGVPLAALEGVSLVSPDGVPLAAPVSVSLAAPDDVTPPPNGFPLVAPVGVPPPPDDIHPPLPDGSPLTAPDGVPPPPPPNDLPLVPSDDLHLSHSKKWTRTIADEDFRFPPDTKTEVLRQKWRRMRKDDPKLSILLNGPSRLEDEMLGLGGTPGGVPLAALEGVSVVAPDGVPLAALEGVSLVAPDGVPLAAPVSVSLAAPDGITPPPNGFPLMAPVGVPPPPDDIRPPPPDGSPLTTPDGVPPPPPSNDLPLVAFDDLYLRTLMAQRQQRSAPFVFTPQLELDLKRGVYRHNSHSKKWTRIIADEDFRFPPDTKIEVLRQKWRRMRKDDPKLSILLSGPSRLAYEMLGLGGTPGDVPLADLEGVTLVAPDGVPLAAVEGVSLVAPDGVPLAAPVSVSLVAPDGVTPPPNGFPLMAPVGVPSSSRRHSSSSSRRQSSYGSRRGSPPPPPMIFLLWLPMIFISGITLMAQRQQRAAPFVFTPQLELVLKCGVYRHNSHSKKWTRIIADEDFRFPPDTKTEVLRQKWRRMRKDDPKLSILLSGPSRLAYEMLGLGGTPGDVPLGDLEGVTLVAPDGVPLAAVEGVSLVAPDGVPLAAPVSVSLAAPDGVTPPPNGFPLMAPVGVPPPPDDIRPPPPDRSPLTAPDGVPPPPPPNDLPLVASDNLHLRTLMAQRQQRAAPFVFTPQLELDLKRGVYRHNNHSKKWTRTIADEDFRFPPDTKTEVLRQKWRRMRKDDPKLSILLNGPSRLEDEMLGLGGTPGGVPLAVLEGVSLVAPDGVPLAALEGVSLMAPDGVPLVAPVSVSLAAPDGVTPPPNGFPLVAPVGVPPPPNDIRPLPPDGSPLTAPDGVPPPPPSNDLPLVASDDLYLRNLMAQSQQRAAPFVFTPQLELDLKHGVYRHNNHSKKWTRIIADEDFRFPPDTKTEVLRQKWRRMCKDDPKLSILLNGPSRLEDEMLGLGGTPGGVPLAALEGVSLVAPDGVALAAPISVSLAAPDGVTPPPNGFPLVASFGVPPPPDDIRPPPPDGSPLTAPDGVPPPPPPNALPLVASDDLHLKTRMAQRQPGAASFVFTPQLELDLKRGVYRHNSHSKKWTRIIADEDFRFPPDTKTEVLRQKWRRMRKDDPKLSILLNGPSRLADEMLGLGGTPGGVPLAALEGVSLVVPDGVPLVALEGVSLVAPDGVPVAAPDSVSLVAPDGVTPPPNGFPIVAPVGVSPPPDDIRPPLLDGSPLTTPDGVPPPPNDLPLVASDDLHLRTLMAQRQQRAAPFVFTPQLELDLKHGVYRHNNHSKKWTRIIADEDFRFPPDTKTEVLRISFVTVLFFYFPFGYVRQKWRRMRKDDPKLSILLSGPSRLADEMLGLGSTPCGVPLAALECVSLVTTDGVPLAALEGVSLVAPDDVPLAAPVSVSLAAPDDLLLSPTDFYCGSRWCSSSSRRYSSLFPDDSPLTAPDGVPPPPPPNDLPLVASDDLHLRTLMAQRQQRAAPFVFTPQLELDLKHGVYRHNSHSKKWTRIIADEDFRFPPDTKTEVLQQKWRRMRKDDPKLSILLSGPSRLADEMLGLGGTPGGVPLAALEGVSLVVPDGVPLVALEGVSLVAPDGVPVAAPDSVSLVAPDGVTPPPNGFPIVAPVGVSPPPDDIRPPLLDGSPLTTPDGVPPPPPPNDLPLVASDDLHLRTLMAQRQQRAAPFVFTPQLELDLKHGVYRHNNHSKKWTRIIADEDFRFPPDTKTEVLRISFVTVLFFYFPFGYVRQKWRRMRKDDPKLSILLSGPSRLADEMLGLGGTPCGVPLAALECVSLVTTDGVPLAALEGVSLVAPDDVPLAAPVSVSLAAPDDFTPPPNGFLLGSRWCSSSSRRYSSSSSDDSPLRLPTGFLLLLLQ